MSRRKYDRGSYKLIVRKERDEIDRILLAPHYRKFDLKVGEIIKTLRSCNDLNESKGGKVGGGAKHYEFFRYEGQIGCLLLCTRIKYDVHLGEIVDLYRETFTITDWALGDIVRRYEDIKNDGNRETEQSEGWQERL